MNKAIRIHSTIAGLFVFTIFGTEAFSADERIAALESVRKYCSGGFGTLAEGERSSIKFENKEIIIKSGNRVFFTEDAGNTIRNLEFTKDDYISCGKEMTAALGINFSIGEPRGEIHTKISDCEIPVDPRSQFEEIPIQTGTMRPPEGAVLRKDFAAVLQSLNPEEVIRSTYLRFRSSEIGNGTYAQVTKHSADTYAHALTLFGTTKAHKRSMEMLIFKYGQYIGTWGCYDVDLAREQAPWK